VHHDEVTPVARKDADASPISEVAGEDSVHLAKKEDDEAEKQKLREKARGFGLPATFKPKFEKNRAGKWILMKKPAPAAKGGERRKRSTVTPELKDAIVQALQAGKTANVVAGECGVSPATVNNIKRAAGLTKKREEA
ncbi:MAG: transposase family protein, partial [Opitutaceae bacterium]